MRDLTAAGIHRLLLSLVVGLLVHGSAALAQSGGNYSANCGKPTAPTFLSPGTWNGTFEVQKEARLDKGEVNLPLVITLDGKLRVKAGKAGKFEDASGELRSRFGGAGQGAGGATIGTEEQATIHLSFDKDESLSPDRLILKGSASGFHRTRGDAAGPLFENESEVGGKDIVLRLLFRKFSCDQATGVVLSPEVDATMAKLAAGGYVAGPEKATFRLENETNVSKKVAELRQELDRVAPVPTGSIGDSMSRENMGNWLKQVKDRIDSGPPELVPCLTEAWQDHVDKVVAGQARADVSALDDWNRDGTYSGPGTPMYALSNRATGTSKFICLVAREACSVDLDAALLKAVQAGYTRLLKGMIRDRAAPENILATLQKAQLLGAVAPAMRDRAAAAVTAEADRLRMDKAADLARNMASHAGEPCHVSIANAYVRALHAEQFYQLNGGDPETRPELARAEAACPNLRSYSGPPGAS
jgi:hypothetical protein